MVKTKINFFKKLSFKKPSFSLKGKKGRRLVVGLLVFLLLFSLPALLTLPRLSRTARATFTLAQQIAAAARNQDLVAFSEKLPSLETQLTTLQNQYRWLRFYRWVPWLGGYWEDGQAGLTAASHLLEAGDLLVQALMPYADVLGLKGKGSFTGGTTEDRIAKIIETLDEVTPKLDAVAQHLTAAQEALNQVDPADYPSSFRGLPVREKLRLLKELVDAAVVAVTDAKPALEVLPQVLGTPDPRRYLVIFQNDTELRPTGGFMTAYAILTVDHGKIRAEKSDDIYTLDKKFGQRLPAPEPIKKYHKNVYYWHLRDMNLSPDFKLSMDTFLEHYRQVPGEPEVDGIVAVDTQLLTRLVELLGPLNVPGYGRFTAETDPRCNCPQVIYQLELLADQPTHTWIENRKGVLGPLMQEIIFKAMAADKKLWPELFRTGWQALESRHALLYFVDPQEQEAAEKLGFAGRIKQPPDSSWDYLMLVDSNFAGAKSNLYIEQTVTQELELTDEGLFKTVTIEYRNPQPPDDCSLERKGGLCLSGLYRDWIRLYVPKGSKLIEVLGSEIPPTSYAEGEKTVFEAFYGNQSPLRPLGKAKVVFRYKLPFTPQDEYRLFIQKQAGTKDFTYIVKLGSQTHQLTLSKDTTVRLPLNP